LDFIRRHSSVPFRTGIMMSANTRFGRSLSIICGARACEWPDDYGEVIDIARLAA
jgi:hypothetical protein